MVVSCSSIILTEPPTSLGGIEDIGDRRIQYAWKFYSSLLSGCIVQRAGLVQLRRYQLLDVRGLLRVVRRNLWLAPPYASAESVGIGK